MAQPIMALENENVLLTRRTAEIAIEGEKELFKKINGRDPTIIVLSNISAKEVMKWDADSFVRGEIDNLCGLTVFVSPRVKPLPGFLLV